MSSAVKTPETLTIQDLVGQNQGTPIGVIDVANNPQNPRASSPPPLPRPDPEKDLTMGTLFSSLLGSQRDVVDLTRDVADEMAKTNSSIWEIKAQLAAANTALAEIQRSLSTSGFKTPRWMVAFMIIQLIAVLVLAGVQVSGMSHREPASFPLDVLNPIHHVDSP